MENGPFIDDFPINTSIYKGFSMAMLNNQRVITQIFWRTRGQERLETLEMDLARETHRIEDKVVEDGSMAGYQLGYIYININRIFKNILCIYIYLGYLKIFCGYIYIYCSYVIIYIYMGVVVGQSPKQLVHDFVHQQ